MYSRFGFKCCIVMHDASCMPTTRTDIPGDRCQLDFSMSGSSWFDLSSIQEQINKSLQDAAKIAEDASKYDILNFDEMAKQEGEVEEDDDEDDEFEENKHYSRESAEEFSGCADVTFAELDVESSKILKDRRHYVHEHLTPHNSSHGPSDHLKLDEEPRRNIESMFGGETSCQLQSAQDSGIAGYASPFRDKQNASSKTDSQAITSFNILCSVESVGCATPFADTPCGVLYETSRDDITAVKASSGPVELESVDDFFGDQFNAIITIKAEKTRTSVTTDTSATELSRENISKPKVEGRGFNASDPSSREKIISAPPQYPTSLHKSVQSISKNKSSKKKKNKGGLDFFGMGGDEAATVPLPASSIEQSDLACKAASDTTYSFFEPVGMLNDDEVESLKSSDNVLGQEDSPYPQFLGVIDSSVNRLPQRLPGIVFPTTAVRNSNSDSMSIVGATAGKSLFSYFDNVEDEIDSNEDPILRQVALNITNPRPKGWTQINNNPVGVFIPLSSSGRPRGERDFENHSAGNRSTAFTSEGEDGDTAQSNSSFNSISEVLIIFSRGLCGCIATACSEACNGVGAPLGFRTDLASRLRRGEAVPVTVPSSSSDGTVDRDGLQFLLTVSSTLRDPQVRRLPTPSLYLSSLSAPHCCLLYLRHVSYA
jgi:hypothetical protein